MSDKATNVPNVPQSPYEDMAFNEFIKQIGNANLPNWSIVAEALGVSRKTIYRWRQTPEGQAALSNAIEENLREMEVDGKGDWRMRREKLKMLGVRDVTTLEHEAGESVTDLLDRIESNYGELGRKAKGQVVADNAPLQDKE